LALFTFYSIFKRRIEAARLERSSFSFVAFDYAQATKEKAGVPRQAQDKLQAEKLP